MDHLATINKHARDDSIQFDEEPHIYTVHGDSTYISVTTLCHSHFEKFDADRIIDNMMKSCNWHKSKYFGMSKQDIKDQWNKNGCNASAAGTEMHKMIEDYYQHNIFGDDVDHDSKWVRYFKNFLKDYPHLQAYRTEWMVWDSDLKLAGSIDMVFKDTRTNTYAIYDWKRCKDIRKVSFGGKFSTTPCIEHLPDSNFWHYSLQLNIYQAILEKYYGITISERALVQIHPDKADYVVYKVPDLQNEVVDLFQLRKKDCARET